MKNINKLNLLLGVGFICFGLAFITRDDFLATYLMGVRIGHIFLGLATLAGLTSIYVSLKQKKFVHLFGSLLLTASFGITKILTLFIAGF